MTQLISPPLPYATALTRAGISVQQNDFGIRIIVPPLQSWRQIPTGYFIGFAALVFFLAEQIGMAMWFRGSVSALVMPVTILGGGALLVVYFASRLLRRRTVIDVTQAELIITLFNSRGLARCLVWPRLAVSEIKVNISNGKLLIRSPAYEMKDFYLGNRCQIIQEIADCVRQAVFDGNFTSCDQLPFPSPVRTSSKKLIELLLLSIVAGVFVCGVVLLVLRIPLGVVLIMLSVIAAIPIAGIIHGTQNKEFFT